MSEAYGIWKDVIGGYKYWAETARLDFSVLLGEKMDEQKISKTALAEKAGVSKSYVSKVLGGDTNFTIDSMAKFMFALGLRLNIETSPLHDKFEYPKSSFVYNSNGIATNMMKEVKAQSLAQTMQSSVLNPGVEPYGEIDYDLAA